MLTHENIYGSVCLTKVVRIVKNNNVNPVGSFDTRVTIKN